MSASTPLPDAIWYTRCAVPTPVSLAVLNGSIAAEFAADNLPLKSLRDSTDPAELASHFDHTLPHSFRQGGSVPAIWARASGRDTKVIALTWTDEFQAIVALPRSGIRSVRDLKGRRIGIPHHAITIDHNRASALRAFSVILPTEGLGLKDVERIDLPDPEGEGEAPRRFGRRGHSYRNEALALAEGRVDAVYVKDVRGLELIDLLGATVVADIGFHPDPYIRISNCAPRPLTVNAETLALYPDLVERFLARTVAAGEWAAAHPDETVARVSQETGWSEKAVRRAFGDRLHFGLGADLAPSSIKGLGTFIDYLAESGAIPTRFAVEDWIDPAPLDAVLRRRDRKVA
jgi:ABC-type nitrate/sulfonate/bicarbonate transport system substrate-binding protein